MTIFQSWSREYQPLADITWPNKQDYCRRHGYNAVAYVHNKRHPVNLIWDRPEQWGKMLESLPDGDVCLFLGCDTLITRPDLRLEQFLATDHDLFVLIDGDMVFGDVLAARANYKTRQFFQKVASNPKNAPNEQWAIGELLLSRPIVAYLTAPIHNLEFWSKQETELQSYGLSVKVLNGMKFSSDDILHWDGGDIPGFNGPFPKEYGWTREHLILHMGGKSLEYRLEHLPKYVAAMSASL